VVSPRGKERSRRADGRPVGETIRDHVRAIVAGLLVGLPLLWTQEMWRNGETLHPIKLLVLLAGAFVIIVAFNAVSGFRRERSWLQLLIDSIQGIGLSVVISASVLYVLGRLEPELGLATVVGRVALQTIPVAFGTALAATILSNGGSGGRREAVGPVGELFVAAGGALYFALNIAPTDEVRSIGSEADTPLVLLAVAVSLAMGLGTVLTIHRSRGSWAWFGGGPLDGPVGETIAGYAVALLVSFGLLWSFDLVGGLGVRALIGHVVMLGVVASFGAAAGRTLVGDGSAQSGTAGARGRAGT
jgi:putative integral membrane protein (TIGR02587 family)